MKKTKIFLDTEFTGLHQKTTLVSIGMISECGKTFYAELNDFDEDQLDPWLQENVIKNLIMSEPELGEDEYYCASRHLDNPLGNSLYDSYSVQLRCDTGTLRTELNKWFAQFDEIEMWGDCIAYDWVLFSQIWGNACLIPSNIFYIPFDICTLFKCNDIDPDINREKYCDIQTRSEKHNSLWDAKVIKQCYEKILGKL